MVCFPRYSRGLAEGPRPPFASDAVGGKGRRHYREKGERGSPLDPLTYFRLPVPQREVRRHCAPAR